MNDQISREKLTLEDYRAAVESAKAAAAAATKVLEQAKGAYAARFGEFYERGDEVGLRRLREGISVATEREADALRDLELHRGRLRQAQSAASDLVIAQLRANVERLGVLQGLQALDIRQACEALSAAIEQYRMTAEELRADADALLVTTRELAKAKSDTEETHAAMLRMPTAVRVDDFRPLFAISDIMHLVGIDMYVLTNGKWQHKNVGLDLYTLSQGPRFDHRVKEYTTMLLHQLPKPLLEYTLPPAA